MEDCPLYEFRPVSRTNSPTLLSGVAKNDTPQDFPEEAMLRARGTHPLLNRCLYRCCTHTAVGRLGVNFS